MDTRSHNTDSAATAGLSTPTMGQLSFTSRRTNDSGVNLWSPTDFGDDWTEQCRLGREYGREAVKYICETNDAALLPGIVRAIAERGIVGGVEVGFFTLVSMKLARTG